MDEIIGNEHYLTSGNRRVIIPYYQTSNTPLQIYDLNRNDITNSLTLQEENEIYEILQIREESSFDTSVSSTQSPQLSGWSLITNSNNNDYNVLQLSSNRIVNIPITQTVSDTLYVFDNNNEEITDLTENERDEIISFLTLSNIDVSPISRINNIDSTNVTTRDSSRRIRRETTRPRPRGSRDEVLRGTAIRTRNRSLTRGDLLINPNTNARRGRGTRPTRSTSNSTTRRRLINSPVPSLGSSNSSPITISPETITPVESPVENINTQQIIIRQHDTFPGEGVYSSAIKVMGPKHFLVADVNDNTSNIYDKFCIKLWNSETHSIVRKFTGHSDIVGAIEKLDDDHFITGSNDKTIKIWKITDERPIDTFNGHNDHITSLAVFSPGIFISGSIDKTVILWNMPDGFMRRRVIPIKYRGHRDRVLCVDVFKDDNTFISGSSDNTIKLWDSEWDQSVSTGAIIRTFLGHTDDVTALTILNNAEFVSASEDSMKIWNKNNSAALRTLNHDLANIITGIMIFDVIALNSKNFVTTDMNDTITLWNTNNGIVTSKKNIGINNLSKIDSNTFISCGLENADSTIWKVDNLENDDVVNDDVVNDYVVSDNNIVNGRIEESDMEYEDGVVGYYVNRSYDYGNPIGISITLLGDIFVVDNEDFHMYISKMETFSTPNNETIYLFVVEGVTNEISNDHNLKVYINPITLQIEKILKDGETLDPDFLTNRISFIYNNYFLPALEPRLINFRLDLGDSIVQRKYALLEYLMNPMGNYKWGMDTKGIIKNFTEHNEWIESGSGPEPIIGSMSNLVEDVIPYNKVPMFGKIIPLFEGRESNMIYNKVTMELAFFGGYPDPEIDDLELIEQSHDIGQHGHPNSIVNMINIGRDPKLFFDFYGNPPIRYNENENTPENNRSEYLEFTGENVRANLNERFEEINDSPISNYSIASNDTEYLSSELFLEMKQQYIRFLEKHITNDSSINSKEYNEITRTIKEYEKLLNYRINQIRNVNPNEEQKMKENIKNKIIEILSNKIKKEEHKILIKDILEKLYFGDKLKKQYDVRLIIVSLNFVLDIESFVKKKAINDNEIKNKNKKFVKEYFDSFKSLLEDDDNEDEIIENFHVTLLNLIEKYDSLSMSNEYYSEFYRILLLMNRYPVNTLDIESYMDMTTYIQNEISLEKYLQKRDNIVIQIRNEYKKDKDADGNDILLPLYILTQKSKIKKLLKNPRTCFYGCYTQSGYAGESNLDKSIVYIDNVGLDTQIGNKFWDVHIINEFPYHQIFVLQNLDKNFPSYSTLEAHMTPELAGISSWHCNVDNPAKTAILLLGYSYSPSRPYKRSPEIDTPSTINNSPISDSSQSQQQYSQNSDNNIENNSTNEQISRSEGNTSMDTITANEHGLESITINDMRYFYNRFDNLVYDSRGVALGTLDEVRNMNNSSVANSGQSRSQRGGVKRKTMKKRGNINNKKK